MFPNLIGFLIWLLVACLLFWLVLFVVNTMDLPPSVRKVVLVIVGLIALVWLLAQAGALGPRVVLIG